MHIGNGSNVHETQRQRQKNVDESRRDKKYRKKRPSDDVVPCQ
jgi:hypothetical protein